jgi:hypothetical protein
VKAPGILGGAHQRRANIQGYFETTTGEKQDIASLQRGTIFGRGVGAYYVQIASVSPGRIRFSFPLVYSGTLF